MSTILLENIQIFAYHGCFSEEKIVGTHFRIDLSFDLDTEKAEESDELHDTVSYLDVFQLVKKEMQSASNLLEHVGRRIIKILKETYPQISHISVKISKLNPPLGGDIEAVAVLITD